MDFIALDFETANQNSHSVCEIGISKVKNGIIVESFSRLVRPRNNWFKSINVGIHGIDAETVKNEPEFNELWEDIGHLFQGCNLVAHNAAFDIGVLKSVLDLYDIGLPEINYACTVQMARKTWRGLPSYSLGNLSEFLGVTLERHHRAGDDAQACAEIAIQSMEICGVNHFSEIPKKIGTAIKKVEQNEYVPMFRANGWRSKELPSIDPQLVDKSHTYSGKNFVFTGKLSSMTRKEAQINVLKSGGQNMEHIDRNTDFLVLGNSSYDLYLSGKKSRKTQQAEELQNHGYDVNIISEKEFLKTLELPSTGSLF